jgi:hypothetical protein
MPLEVVEGLTSKVDGAPEVAAQFHNQAESLR